MLTAILLAHDVPARPLRRDAIARSLASMVHACVEGLVADAILTGAPGKGLEQIADEAGCALVETNDAREGLTQALALARYDDVFLLQAGHAVQRGFVEEVNDAFAYGERGRALVLRGAPETFITRLAPRFADPVGVVARKEAISKAASADLRRIARAVGGAELRSPARQTF